jgi:nucleotide-binding universal stress UspA family protein
MMRRILVAVDDSPPALAAASAAIDLAAHQDAQIHFVSVTEPDHHDERVLEHVAELARQAGLTPVVTTTDGGHPFEVLLAVAHEWQADLIVMGRSDKRRPGLPYVGSQTEHLLEFTHVPVLVVPHPKHETRAQTAGSGSAS